MTPNTRQTDSPEIGNTDVLRPRARLLRTIGSDLISSDKVALVELVKNSYDADANTVVVRFIGPLQQGHGRIEVWDNGCGMDSASIRDSWLDIATDVKRRKSRSAGGRRVLGEKGIGRFAASRLGNEMLLTSRKVDSDEVSLLINWADFDRDDAYLDQIEIAWETAAPSVFASAGEASTVLASEHANGHAPVLHGTVLRIEGLSHDWEKADVIELRTALMRLVRPRPTDPIGLAGAPTQIEGVAEFGIALELVDVDDQIADLAGPIEPSPELSAPHYRLSGKVDARGVAALRYTQQSPPNVLEIPDKQLWDNKQRLPQTGPFTFDMSVWDLDRSALLRGMQKSGAHSSAPQANDIQAFRQSLETLAGVSIYRDGFRVLPFGEPGDDWLGLDLRRVQAPTRRISNNQIIGHIFIEADSNTGLKDQSNREGILASAAYSDLQLLIRAALSELETRRYKSRHSAGKRKRQQIGMFQRFDLREVRNEIAQKYPDDARLINLVDRKYRDIEGGIKEVQNVLSRYSRLATLGSLVDRVLHDGRTYVARLKNTSRFGSRDLSNSSLPDSTKVQKAREAMDDTAKQAELLSSLFRQIEPFGGRKRGRPKSIDMRTVVDNAVAILSNDAAEKAVDVENACDHLQVKIDESELLTVLTNLIQNAIYWTGAAPRNGTRKVVVSARLNDDGSMTLEVGDSGPGVEEDVRDHIFDPYFSTKPDGVGLGLSISGNIVEDIYGGELVLVDRSPLGGATFEATFRRRV